MNPDAATSPAGTFSARPGGSRGGETPGENLKRNDWIPFISPGVAQAAPRLGIAGFGFAHLNARMDRIEARPGRFEERLDGLDRRVFRIEGVLRLRSIDEVAAEPSGAPGDGA